MSKRLNEDEAAVKIQAVWKGKTSRKERKKEDDAAKIIQSCWKDNQEKIKTKK
jgi:hypothetical protein